MSIFNSNVTEIIEERRRAAQHVPKRINSAAEKKRAKLKQRMDNARFQKEIDGINGYDY